MTQTDVGTAVRTAASNISLPYYLTLVAGALVIINGLVFMGIRSGLGISAFGGGFALGLVGVLLGIILLYSAVKLNANPSEHVAWGAVIILFSVVSLILVGGGFILGFILGLVGGILAIAWRA
jgi:hypothetical protein